MLNFDSCIVAGTFTYPSPLSFRIFIKTLSFTRQLLRSGAVQRCGMRCDIRVRSGKVPASAAAAATLLQLLAYRNICTYCHRFIRNICTQSYDTYRTTVYVSSLPENIRLTADDCTRFDFILSLFPPPVYSLDIRCDNVWIRKGESNSSRHHVRGGLRIDLNWSLSKFSAAIAAARTEEGRIFGTHSKRRLS